MIDEKQRPPARSETGAWTRRSVLAGIGAAGSFLLACPALAQRKSVRVSFWTFENPQLRPWLAKRVALFVERNPNVEVDFQAFTFADLGKKISVGFATGTAPEGFVSQDWMMPTWQSKSLLAPLDVTRLGYDSLAAFKDDFPPAFVEGAVAGDAAFGYPSWFYGFLNYINVRHFEEAGLDPEADAPLTWEQFGETARRLTIRDGADFTRQGFKFATHAAQWTMVQFNPILIGAGGSWFDADGASTINNAAGVRAMSLRASIAREYGAEDPAETIATNPLPQMDWLKERCSMFWCHPIPPAAIAAQNPAMAADDGYRVAQYAGIDGKPGFPTTYGFNFVVSAQAAPEQQEALHELYAFIMSDPADCWYNTQPFPIARRSGWSEMPEVRAFPQIDEILAARDNGVLLPRTPVYNEVADAVHRAVQRIMLNDADIQQSLDAAAAEIDRASARARG